MSLPIVSIIGRPNVGKSRLFNRMVGKKVAIVSDVAGTTRDPVSQSIDDAQIPYRLVDTGGLDFLGTDDTLEQDVQKQARIALQESDLILFVSDSQKEPLPDDFKVAELLRKSEYLEKGRVVFVISKCDDPLDYGAKASFYTLGMGAPQEVSAIHNRGIKELKSLVSSELKKLGYSASPKEENTEVTIPKIAFVGRPNVGKSSLINAYFQEERLIVSDVSGTTRDSTDTEVQWEKKPFLFIDTAGIKRRGKLKPGIEKWAYTRTLQSLERTDIACLLIDGEEGVVAQDQHVAESILAEKTGVIIIVNKWDTQEKGEDARNAFIDDLRYHFPFLSWAPVLFVSAKTKQNIVKLFPLIENIMEERQKRITTGKLNTFARHIMTKHLPTGTKNVFPKIYFMSQVDINPPKFKLFVNKKEYFHFSYFRYIENRIREMFGFQGTCIDIDVTERESIYKK